MHAKVVLTWCLLLVAGTSTALADAAGFRKFLDDSRGQLREVELSRANPPFAAIHELSPPGKALEYEGRFYSGFRFTTPEWLDGGLIWMFALVGPDANWDKAGYKWSLAPEEESAAKIKLEGTRYGNNKQNGFIDGMLSMAALEFLGGDWQRALERQFWADDWLARNFDKAFEAKAKWFGIHGQIAETLQRLGLLEAADAECRVVLAKDWVDPYDGRAQLFAKHRRMAIQIALGAAEEAMLEELAALRETLDKNRSVGRFHREDIDVTRARCLAALGRFADADALLGKLVDGGNRSARVERLRLRLDAHKVAGLEGRTAPGANRVTRDGPQDRGTRAVLVVCRLA